MSSAPAYHDPSAGSVPSSSLVVHSDSSQHSHVAPASAVAAGGPPVTHASHAAPVAVAAAPAPVTTAHVPVDHPARSHAAGYAGVAGAPGYWEPGIAGAPAADLPPQEVDPDEDVWTGGLVQYDARGYRYPVVKRSFADRVLGLRDFGRPMIWRAAFIEFIGTTLWVLYLCAGVIGFTEAGYTDIGLFWYSVVILLLLPLLIFSTTVASGGHLNPIITLATCLAGFTKVSRAILYILAQFAGGILAAALVWGWLGDLERDVYGAGNCSAGPLSRSQALLVETVANFFFVFVVFGVALDPAQRVIFGPIFGPIFLSAAFAIIVFFTGLSGRYMGAWINPAHCFGSAVISGRFDMEVWISIIAWLMASLFMGILYLLVPFNHEIRSRNNRAIDHHNKQAAAHARAPHV